jgi:hypothetical protein
MARLRTIGRMPDESTKHLVKRMEAEALAYGDYIGYGIFRISYRNGFGFRYVNSIHGLSYPRDKQTFINSIDKYYER